MACDTLLTMCGSLASQLLPTVFVDSDSDTDGGSDKYQQRCNAVVARDDGAEDNFARPCDDLAELHICCEPTAGMAAVEANMSCWLAKKEVLERTPLSLVSHSMRVRTSRYHPPRIYISHM